MSSTTQVIPLHLFKKMLIFIPEGGKNKDGGWHNEVFKWDDTNEEWIQMDNLIQGRDSHAVSTVVINDGILNYCFGK